MGRNQHSKDRLYLTRTEHASGEHRGTGKLAALHLPYRTLPYDCCAISFRPFETPLCTSDGIVFELLNIVPYLKKFHRHPVTGKPLAATDLIMGIMPLPLERGENFPVPTDTTHSMSAPGKS